MKKFIAILLVLLMIPLYAFASGNPSPTLKRTIYSNPVIKFELADETEGWQEILKRLENVTEETEGYILLEALQIKLDKQYEKVEWTLTFPVTSEYEPFVLIINSEAIVKQETSITENGAIIIDFTDYEPNTYYICFYIKGA